MSLLLTLLVLSNKQKLPPKTKVKGNREVKGHSYEKIARINPSGNVLITVSPGKKLRWAAMWAPLGLAYKQTEKLQCKYRPTDKT